MKSPHEYKTRFGLYKATTRRLDKGDIGCSKAYWIQTAKDACKEKFPDLYPQLLTLISSYEPKHFGDLVPIA